MHGPGAICNRPCTQNPPPLGPTASAMWPVARGCRIPRQAVMAALALLDPELTSGIPPG